MKIDEETFLNGNKNATIEVKFLADNKATTYYNLLGNEEIEICFIKKLSKLFYFFDSLEDMKKGNQKERRKIKWHRIQLLLLKWKTAIS